MRKYLLCFFSSSFGIVICSIGILFCFLQSSLQLRWLQLEAKNTNSLFYLPKVSIVKPFLLGQEGIAADLMWIRTLGYAADEVLSKGKLGELEHLIDFITDLDPRFEKVYMWAGAITIYNGGRITTDKIMASTRILEKGWNYILSDPRSWKHDPNYWTIPQMIGFNYTFELNDRKKGAPYFAQAAELPGASENLKTLAATLYKKSGNLDEGTKSLETSLLIHFLQDQLQVADEATKRKIEIRLEQYYRKLYGDENYLQKFKAFQENLQKTVQAWRQDYAELDFGLYMILFGTEHE